SGSVHRYYRHPGANIKIWCSTSYLGNGIDCKGDGGMVIGPPSKRPDGQYRWLNKYEIAEPPSWLVDKVTKRAAKRPKAGRADKKLDEACAEMAAAAEGDRNDTLNRLAFGLAKLIKRGQLDEDTARERLTEAARDAGLEEREIEATLDSAITAGKG